MNFITKSVICVAISTMLTGCLSTNSDNGQVDPRLEQSSFIRSSYLVGCAAGAAGGALIGLLAHGNKGKGVLIGAAAGCAAGLVANFALDNYKDKYKTKEAQLDAVNRDLTAENKRLTNFIAVAETINQENTQKLLDIESDYKANKISKSQIDRMIKDADLNIEFLNKNKAEAQKQLAQIKELRKELVGNEVALSNAEKKKLFDLNNQIDQTEENIKKLSNHSAEAISNRNSLSTIIA